jgi:uncharacterized membrane protein
VPDADKSIAPSLAATDLPPAPPWARPASWVEHWHKPAFILFLVASLVTLTLLWLRIELAPAWRWFDTLCLGLAAITSLLALGRRLPTQNVLMSAALIASISGGILLVATASGVPFGPLLYSDALGEKIFQTLPWPVPLLWVVIIVNARGVARLAMRPWRKTNFYGFWVIGLACLLAMIFDLGLEPFAVFVKGWWGWQLTRSARWYTAPWVNWLGWFITALAVLAFTTPWLINKQPVKRPIDYHPLIVWLLLSLILAVGNAAHGLWPPVWVSLVANAGATVLAVRGARW